MLIKAKSKTFLAGEYCITVGGSAIVLCTLPFFSLRVEPSNETLLRNIREGSPAFAFYMRNRQLFENLFIKFNDPYRRTGGFGASSAQFALLYALKELLVKDSSSIKYLKGLGNENILGIMGKKGLIRSDLKYTKNFLEEYHTIIPSKSYEQEKPNKKLKFNEEITKKIEFEISSSAKESAQQSSVIPSGADCLAQLHNTHIYFNSSTYTVEKLYWPFSDISFTIFKTDQKVATYRHLQKLSVDFLKNNCLYLSKIVEKIRVSWKQNDSKEFAQGIENFSDALVNLKLVTTRTQHILSDIKRIDGVVAAKGCGAMGADTIVVIYEKKKADEVHKSLSATMEEYKKTGL